jgi:hypothetical protein
MKKVMCLIVLSAFLVSLPAFAKNKEYITATDIQKVNLNDTFDDVSSKIGEPNQVLSKELTGEGKEQVVWLYEAVKNPKIKATGEPSTIFTGYTAKTALVMEQTYQQQRVVNPPYLIIFTNGKVSKIDRQKVEVVPTAQVNVQSY